VIWAPNLTQPAGRSDHCLSCTFLICRTANHLYNINYRSPFQKLLICSRLCLLARWDEPFAASVSMYQPDFSPTADVQPASLYVQRLSRWRCRRMLIWLAGDSESVLVYVVRPEGWVLTVADYIELRCYHWRFENKPRYASQNEQTYIKTHYIHKGIPNPTEKACTSQKPELPINLEWSLKLRFCGKNQRWRNVFCWA